MSKRKLSSSSSEDNWQPDFNDSGWSDASDDASSESSEEEATAESVYGFTKGYGFDFGAHVRPVNNKLSFLHFHASLPNFELVAVEPIAKCAKPMPAYKLHVTTNGHLGSGIYTMSFEASVDKPDKKLAEAIKRSESDEEHKGTWIVEVVPAHGARLLMLGDLTAFHIDNWFTLCKALLAYCKAGPAAQGPVVTEQFLIERFKQFGMDETKKSLQGLKAAWTALPVAYGCMKIQPMSFLLSRRGLHGVSGHNDFSQGTVFWTWAEVKTVYGKPSDTAAKLYANSIL